MTLPLLRVHLYSTALRGASRNWTSSARQVWMVPEPVKPHHAVQAWLPSLRPEEQHGADPGLWPLMQQLLTFVLQASAPSSLPRRASLVTLAMSPLVDALSRP